MSKSTDDAVRLARKQQTYSAPITHLARNGEGLDGDKIALAIPTTPAPKRSAAACYQDLAASCEFSPTELREAIDGLDLLGMSRLDPHAFATLAKEVGAKVRGMSGPDAVRAVIRAIMSGKKRPGK